MKKTCFWIFILFAALGMGCSHKATHRTAIPGGETPQDFGAHSSMNALDYFGRYLPETSGSSLDWIELAEWGKYTLQLAGGTIASGKYRWDVTGTTITLDLPGNQDTQMQFWVGENFMKLISKGPGQDSLFRKICNARQ